MLIGIDAHKTTNVVAAVNERGELLEHANFSAKRADLRALKRWAKRFPARRWAVKGASGLGRAVVQHLVTCA